MTEKFFSVIDVETTGLFAAGSDRIIEIAIVRMNQEGGIVDEYCTLVNPCRDIGPTRIHGIHAWEVKNAPTFDEIIGDVSSRLGGSILVAHNATFDLGFLSAEFVRSGFGYPTLDYLCTLRLAGKLDLDIPSRKLLTLCEYFDIQLPTAHSALHDARATSALLGYLMRSPKIVNQEISIQSLHRSIAGTSQDWSPCSLSGRVCSRGEALSPSSMAADLIGKLVSHLPHEAADPENLQDYMALLDQVLEDRRITVDESEKLLEVALAWGLNPKQVATAHRKYIKSLVMTALEDGVLTEFESTDLSLVAQILCVPALELNLLIKTGIEDVKKSDNFNCDNVAESGMAGCSICFTGELTGTMNGRPISREFAQSIATRNGMIVKSGVSRKLDYLVMADVESDSGKAVKARAYGTRILSEAHFWRLMRLQVQ